MRCAIDTRYSNDGGEWPLKSRSGAAYKGNKPSSHDAILTGTGPKPTSEVLTIVG